MRGHAGALLEESREMIGAHVDEGTELREAKVPLEILLDVLHHTSESARRQFAARPFGRLGHLIHEPYKGAAVASNVVMASPRCLRRNNRARCTRAFTLGALRPKTSAISRFDRPSTSRRTSTVRATGGKSLIAEVSATRNSVWTEWSSTRADQSAMGPT